LIDGRYRIVYRIDAERCLIVAVLDAAMEWRDRR
jgi:plasmid stabilization system protein ParE